MSTLFFALLRSLLILCLSVVLSGCWGFTTHSYPEDKQPLKLGRFAALAQLALQGGATHKNQQQWLYLDRVYSVTYSVNIFLGILTPDDGVALCRYGDTPQPEMRTDWGVMYVLIPFSYGQYLYAHCSGDTGTVALKWREDAAVDAWTSLARYRPINTAEFDAIAERSRGKRVELNEDVRGFKVRAENAVREKKYWQAADLLDQGLMLNPAWAQGHYNLGLICEELGLYDVAIDEMQKYLKLMPKSENARAIQDKIHIWQGKLRPV